MYLLLADDHEIVLDGLELLLSTFDFVKKVAKAVDSTSLFNHLEHQPGPDIILLDIVFGAADGREICKKIKSAFPHVKLIALTSYSDIPTVKSAIQAGFDGYLLKSEDRNTVIEALHTVSSGASYFSPQVKHIFFEQSITKPKVELTKRETEVLKLIINEKTTKEIADLLFISEKTVENHRANLFLKLEVKNMAGLVKKAISMGID